MARTVGANIAAIRQARGLTQTQLADRLGVRQAAVGKLETQHGYPTLDTLFAYAIELETTVADFIDGVDAEYDALLKKLASKTQLVGDTHPPTKVLTTAPHQTEGGASDADLEARRIQPARSSNPAAELMAISVRLADLSGRLTPHRKASKAGKASTRRVHRRQGFRK